MFYLQKIMALASRDIREVTGDKVQALVAELQTHGVEFESGDDLPMGVYASGSEQTKHRDE